MSENFLLLHVNEWADFESSDAIPLSQGYILANLKKHGYNGQIVGDYKDRPLTPHHFHTCMQELHPKAIGFSVYEENINRVRAWAALAKKIDPEIPVVLGGPQTTFMPGEALEQMNEVDILCRGEGETVMLEIANALAGNRTFKDVAGICCRENGSIVETGICPGSENLDNLPSPYLDEAFDCRGKSRAILLSSRGCSSACTFCYTPRANGRKVRFHSVDRVVAEMQHLQGKGINDFWFADPNFAHSRERLEAFLESIINKVPGASFWCQTRANLVDANLLALLKRAGAHTLAFGLESAHDGILKKIKKGTKLDELSKAIKLTQNAGINVELFSLFGLPGESLENAQQTLDFVKRHDVDIDGNSISQQLHVFFGTPISEDPVRHGISALPITKPAYQSLCRDFQTDGMTEEEIRQMSLIWRLNRKDFAEDIKNGTNLFTIAGFITRHKKYFDTRPEADMMLASIYMHLDECGPAAECFLRLRQKFGSDPAVERFLNRPFIGYRNKRRAIARKGCRIIFDCKGLLAGTVVPETESHFNMATLGDKTLLADFEKGVDGVKAGSATQFEVIFPADYGNRKLAGQKVSFQVYLHQVLEPVVYTNIEKISEKYPRNMFRFEDLFNLKKHNKNLYFMVLRDSVLHSYTGNLPHLMALFNYYLKLGFKEKALDLAYSLPQEPSVLGHAGRVLLANELPEEALEFLQKAADSSAEMENQRLKAHIKLKQYEEAEKIGADPRLATSLQTMNLRVNLASLRQLPVERYLERMNRLLNSQVKMMAAKM
ncbi:MAG: radical SAM protein [Proteobacteria bacterium]|nr:radical SAM protein [Pseudomonadota bacterium]MBU1420770.1 radical SAM protein [Pseudomonadota bacterium]MBU1456882.1 radical SAM protein [Pseudomonadota bacterium]